MIYAAQRALLTPGMGLYVRADTSNPAGWRPNYRPLSGLANGPNWKAVQASRSRSARRQANGLAALQQHNSVKLALLDASARGVLPRGLSFFGSLPTGAAMTNGATYVFAFSMSFLGFNPSTSDVVSAISTDSNFGSPSAWYDSNGNLNIQFVYQGQGSNVLGAAGEIVNVLNGNLGVTQSLVGSSFTFVSADGGSSPTPGLSTPLPQPPTNPGNGSGFNWSSLFAGGAIATVGLFVLGTIVLVKLL